MFTEKWNTDNTLGTEISLEDQVILAPNKINLQIHLRWPLIKNPTSEFLFCSACTGPEADLWLHLLS